MVNACVCNGKVARDNIEEVFCRVLDSRCLFQELHDRRDDFEDRQQTARILFAIDRSNDPFHQIQILPLSADLLSNFLEVPFREELCQRNACDTVSRS